MGSLQQTPLARLLLGLHRDGFSGPLTLRQGSVTKRVTWHRGAPVGVESNAPDEDLVSVLVSEGIVGATDRNEIALCMQERGWDALRAVAALQKAAPKDLVIGLAAQIRRALVSCFAWDDGEFQMDFVEAEAEDAPALPLDVLAVLHTGIATHWPVEKVLVSLGDRATERPVPADGFEEVRSHLPSTEPVDGLVASLDGAQTSISLLQQNPHASAWAALWVLDATAALCWDAEAAAADGEPTTPPVDAPEIEIVVSGSETDSAEAERQEGGVGAPDYKAMALRDEMLDLHGRLGDLDHYTLLGVEKGANPAEVRRAYLKAAKRLHPDRLSNLGLDEVKNQANEVFAQITRAQKVLCDVVERRNYDATLEGHTAVDADRVGQAEVFFRKGETLLRAGNFLEAVDLLDAAVQVWPEEADYQAALAWALHRKNPPENERAFAHFEKALGLGGENAETLLRMSYTVRELGDGERADTLAAKAKQLDPAVKP